MLAPAFSERRAAAHTKRWKPTVPGPNGSDRGRVVPGQRLMRTFTALVCKAFPNVS